MLKTRYLLLAGLLLSAAAAHGQPDPLITRWQLNTTGATGYGGQQANV